MLLCNWIMFMDAYDAMSNEFKTATSFEAYCKLCGVTAPKLPDNVLLFRKG